MISVSKLAGSVQLRVVPHLRSRFAYYGASTSGKKVQSQRQILMKLRKSTGYPLAKCKQALITSNYDVDAAVDELNQNAEKENWEKMENLSVRKTMQGLVTAYRLDNHAVLLEVNCETDFVAKTSDFQSFVGLVARSALANCTSANEKIDLSRDEILKLAVPSKDFTVQDALVKVIGKVKENVNIPRGIVTSVPAGSDEFIGIYTHPDLGTPNAGGRLPLMGRYGAIVGMKTTATESQGSGWLLGKARDLAQHVVGMCPAAIGTRDNVQAREIPPPVEEHRNISQDVEDPGEEDDDDSTAMMAGQEINFSSNELLSQPFLLDANITVQNWLDINRLDVKYFHRYQLGEAGADEDT